MAVINLNEKSKIMHQIDDVRSNLSALQHGLRVNDSPMIIDAVETLDSAYDSLRACVNDLSSRLKALESTEV